MEKTDEIMREFNRALMGLTIRDTVDHGRKKFLKQAKKAIKRMKRHGDDWQVKYMEDKLEQKLKEIKPKGGLFW